jgi:pyridoxal phosphate enzyme (YggS family)
LFHDSAVVIAGYLSSVHGRIEAACARAGRSPGDVTLVAVSKGFSLDAIVEAYGAGQRDFGENRVQEAVAKIEALWARGIAPRWHLIGHLQTNKAKTAAERFAIIQSVDSKRVAEALSRAAAAPLPVLLEVNVAEEASKYGFTPEEVAPALSAIAPLSHIDIRGLMTVAPLTDQPETVRPVFRRLRELRDALGLQELSMGMTNDFEVAIEEGATIVRVGRAIFGERPEA